MYIWFDMDGVLDDFSKSADLIQKNRGPNIPSKKLSGTDKQSRKEFWTKLENEYPDFWLNLPEIENIHNLIDYLKNKQNIDLGIISSPPSLSNVSDKYISVVKQDKIKWLENHFPNTFKNIIISKEEKWKFMKEQNDILIDDREININSWNEHNGIGILFINAKTTLEQLKKILKED